MISRNLIKIIRHNIRTAMLIKRRTT